MNGDTKSSEYGSNVNAHGSPTILKNSVGILRALGPEGSGFRVIYSEQEACCYYRSHVGGLLHLLVVSRE